MTSSKRFSTTFFVVLLGGIPLLACGGQVSLGDDQSQSQAIDPAQVDVANYACPSGYQHANICCTGGNAQAPAQCESWNSDPFHACQPGWSVFPNQAECCSLADPSQCVTCDANGNCAGGGSGPQEPPSCQNDRCPPGWDGISPEDPGGCCRYTASGGECYGFANASDGGEPNVTDASLPTKDGGPAPLDASVDDGGVMVDAGTGPDDAGIIDDGGVEVDAGPPPPPPCDSMCPPDWAPVKDQPGVCCRTAPGGQAEQCFAFPVTGDPSGGGAGGGNDPNAPVAQDAGVKH